MGITISHCWSQCYTKPKILNDSGSIFTWYTFSLEPRKNFHSHCSHNLTGLLYFHVLLRPVLMIVHNLHLLFLLEIISDSKELCLQVRSY